MELLELGMNLKYLVVLGLLGCMTVFADTVRAELLFILGGQSNALGRGDSAELTPPYDAPQTDVKYWTGSGWTDLKSGTGVGSDHGPELSLGRTLGDHFDETIYIVKHAAGGTDLARDWDPQTGVEYATLKTRVNDALAALGSDAVAAGFFWMQGEADSKDVNDANNYQANLASLISTARTDFGNDEMPFVLGRVHDSLYPNPTFGTKYQYADTVRAAQAAITDQVSRTAWVDTDEFGLNDDELHFNSSGQIDLGNGMGEAYFTVPEPATTAGLLLGAAGLAAGRRKRK
jgi:hypothetical protein